MAKTYNLVNYTEEYLYTFEERPFNEVDSLVLSWFCYMNLEASHAMREAQKEEKVIKKTAVPQKRAQKHKHLRARAIRTAAQAVPGSVAMIRKATNHITGWKVWDREAFGTVFRKEFKDAGVKLKELFCAEEFQALVRDTGRVEERIRALTAMASSPRFRSVKLFDYRNELDAVEEENGKQFAAVTFQLTPELFYVAYRGTDRTFTGWKEDFRMTLEEPVPSQRLALSYLEEIADKLPGRILVGGHSKGGNLAVDAAARCRAEVQARIDAVYTHDGPGFIGRDLDTPGFARIRDRIHKTIPQSSLVGLALCQEAEHQIIQTCENGIAAHDPITWQVEDNHFIIRDKLTPESRRMYRKVNNWLEDLSLEDRKLFIDCIFGILESTGEDNFVDLYNNWQTNIPAALRALVDMDEDMQKFLRQVLLQFLTADAGQRKDDESGNEEDKEEEKKEKRRLHLSDFRKLTVRGADVEVAKEGIELKKVAFICVHNSCRSQIAEALGRHLAADAFESYSAGTEVKPQINQDAVRIMKERYGIDMEAEGQHSKLIGDIPEVDLAISMGCNVTCPYIGRDFDDNWMLEDPTGKPDEEFYVIIDAIEKKILELKKSLQ